MPAKQSRRGRPKGSGLDDSGQLAAIAALIDQNPELKPTTAIKSLGISDPSTIRRLRDKYRIFLSHAEPSEKKLPKQQYRSGKTSNKTRTPPATSIPRQVSRAARQPRSQKQMERSADLLGEPASWLTAFFGLGVQAASTTLEIQTATLKHFIALPPVAYAWRQQVTLNDLALFLYKNQKPLLMRFA